jgi:hypothetical protein
LNVRSVDKRIGAKVISAVLDATKPLQSCVTEQEFADKWEKAKDAILGAGARSLMQPIVEYLEANYVLPGSK